MTLSVCGKVNLALAGLRNRLPVKTEHIITNHAYWALEQAPDSISFSHPYAPWMRRERGKRIRSHPLVPKSIPIYGYIYDVKTGRLIEVSVATAAGKAA